VYRDTTLPVFLIPAKNFITDFHFLSTPLYYWGGDCQKMKKTKFEMVSFLSARWYHLKAELKYLRSGIGKNMIAGSLFICLNYPYLV